MLDDPALGLLLRPGLVRVDAQVGGALLRIAYSDKWVGRSVSQSVIRSIDPVVARESIHTPWSLPWSPSRSYLGSVLLVVHAERGVDRVVGHVGLLGAIYAVMGTTCGGVRSVRNTHARVCHVRVPCGGGARGAVVVVVVVVVAPSIEGKGAGMYVCPRPPSKTKRRRPPARLLPNRFKRCGPPPQPGPSPRRMGCAQRRRRRPPYGAVHPLEEQK